MTTSTLLPPPPTSTPCVRDLLHAATLNGQLVFAFRHRRLTDGDELARIERHLAQHLAAAPAGLRVVLDFRRVEQVSSAALGLLLAVRQSTVGRGGSLALVRVAPAVTELLKLTKLDRKFTVLPRLRDAVGPVRRATASVDLCWLD